jgi:hypothetical protein
MWARGSARRARGSARRLEPSTNPHQFPLPLIPNPKSSNSTTASSPATPVHHRRAPPPAVLHLQHRPPPPPPSPLLQWIRNPRARILGPPRDALPGCRSRLGLGVVAAGRRRLALPRTRRHLAVPHLQRRLPPPPPVPTSSSSPTDRHELGP